MKRLIAPVVAVLLLLCGCAAQPQSSATTPATTPIPATQPSGIYDRTSKIEKETDGSIKAYPLALSDTVGFLPMGSDIVLFSGVDETKLTVFSGETLKPSATATLNCRIIPTDPAVQINEQGLTYYDSASGDLVFLDTQLREIRRNPLPATVCGTPALSSDQKTVYYCTADGLRSRDLETGLDRLLKEMYFRTQTVAALHCNDAVIVCNTEDEHGNISHIFISTETGILLYESADHFLLQTRGDFYFACLMDGIYPELLTGDSEQGPTLLNPHTYGSAAYPLLEIGGVMLTTANSPSRTVQLDYYDLHSGKRTAGITLGDDMKIRSIRATAWPHVWFLGHNPQDNRDTLYCWDLSKNTISGERSCFSSRYTFDNPDLEGLAFCREIADELSRKYGVQILLWTDATAYQPWDYTLVPEYQVPVIRENLKELEHFLSLYPEGFLLTAAERTGSGRIQICLVRNILGEESVDGTLQDAVGLQYWDHNANAYLCLSVQDAHLSRNACHEMSHIIDSRVLTVCKAYDDWSSLNPKGFQYNYNQPDQLSLDDRKWTVGPDRAFLDLYSMTYPKEDRARIMEFAMMKGYESCFESDTMQNKLRTLCLGIRKAFHLEKCAKIFSWEQYLKQPLNPK